MTLTLTHVPDAITASKSQSFDVRLLQVAELLEATRASNADCRDTRLDIVIKDAVRRIQDLAADWRSGQ